MEESKQERTKASCQFNFNILLDLRLRSNPSDASTEQLDNLDDDYPFSASSQKTVGNASIILSFLILVHFYYTF